MEGVVRSVSDDQHEILRAIRHLHLDGDYEADITYGNGRFWKDLPEPTWRSDIEQLSDDVVAASSDALPLDDSSLGNVVFDPPFLTYVRAGRNGNGKMVMAQRFGGYWRYDELADHYRATLVECHRVLRPKGILVFKCQDIIHNHKMHATHANVIEWAKPMFRLRDLFILTGGGNLPAPNRRGKQRHARISHSYFLVLENE